MLEQRISSRYAKSLIDLAVEQGKLERILEDVQTFSNLTKNRDFLLFIRNPILQADRKVAIIQQLFSGKYDELTMAFLKILVKKGREALMPDIAMEFIARYKKINQISSVKITSASPLSTTALEAIKKKLEESSLTEVHIEMEQQVDPDLIGGFVIEFGDNIYDASVARQLEDIRKEFSENLYISQIMAR